MKAKLWTKKETQAVLRSLRKAGYDVVKDDAGGDAIYTATIPGETKPYFRALSGLGRGYLVRYEPSLFGETE